MLGCYTCLWEPFYSANLMGSSSDIHDSDLNICNKTVDNSTQRHFWGIPFGAMWLHEPFGPFWSNIAFSSSGKILAWRILQQSVQSDHWRRKKVTNSSSGNSRKNISLLKTCSLKIFKTSHNFINNRSSLPTFFFFKSRIFFKVVHKKIKKFQNTLFPFFF